MKITMTLVAANQTTAAAGYTPQQKAKIAKLKESAAAIRAQLSRFNVKTAKLRTQWQQVRTRRKAKDDPKLKNAEIAIREEIEAVRTATAPMRDKRAKLLKQLKAMRVAAGYRASMKKRKRKVSTKTKQKAKKFKLNP